MKKKNQFPATRFLIALTRNDSRPKYKAGYRNGSESTIPLIFQEIELTARMEINNKYLLHLKPGAPSNKKRTNLATKCRLYKNGCTRIPGLSGRMIADCWRQVGPRPPTPSCQHRTNSFLHCLSAQTGALLRG